MVEQETKLCKNCEKQIETGKFRMHEMQCAKINYKCQECGQIVAKSDKEQHEIEAHVKVKCQHCQFSAGKAIFGSHEERCEMRPKACQYCNQVFKIERWVEHVEICAVKTTKCDKCERFVKNKDLQTHPLSECQKFVNQNEAQKQLEMHKKMEELQKFQEEQQKKIAAKKLEEKLQQEKIKKQQAEDAKKDEEVKYAQSMKLAQQIKQPQVIQKQPTTQQPLTQQPPTKSTFQSQVKPNQNNQVQQPVQKPTTTQKERVPQSQLKPVVQQPLTQPVTKKEEKQSAFMQQVKKPQTFVSPSVIKTKQEIDEIDAALIQQLYEEDESQIYAAQLQDESFGGQPNIKNQGLNQQKQQPVRKADEQRFQRLDGFGETSEEDFKRQADWGNQTAKDMKAAIQASLQQQNQKYQEDEEYAKALEMSRQQR